MKYGKAISFKPEKMHPLCIDRLSTNAIPIESTVLEIGCATGFMGKYLMKKKDCFVTGVEYRREEAAVAKKELSEIVIGNIEDPATRSSIKKKYDIVLASALIQHLKDPDTALTQWRKFFKPQGMLVITCSNIAHWTTRLQLVRGDFQYEEYGLLDNTHLHFYTIKSFKEMITSAGYTIEEFSIDPVGGGYPKISRFLSLFFPGLFAYQMLIVARVK